MSLGYFHLLPQNYRNPKTLQTELQRYLPFSLLCNGCICQENLPFWKILGDEHLLVWYYKNILERMCPFLSN